MRVILKVRPQLYSAVIENVEDVNQSKLAKKLGVTRQMVSFWIKNKMIPTKWIELIEEINFKDVRK